VIVHCATTSKGKLREFHEAGSLANCQVELLPGLDGIDPPVEAGATFEDNAILKALYYGAHTPEYLFADDSGLAVDALGGAPGVFSARYAGAAGDEANNALLLQNLEGVKDRSARFVSVIALVKAGKLVRTFRGVLEGRIAQGPSGSGGFGYDPLFYYPPFKCTFGQASLDRKMQVSHRALAMQAMFEYLATPSR